MNYRPAFVSFVSFVLIQFNALVVRAELVYFASGRTISIKGHHTDGESLVLTLRNGGEIVCEPSMIARIGSDEVPYPDPEEVRLKPDATDASRAADVLGGGRPFDRAQGRPEALEGRLQPDFGAYGPIIDRFSAEQGVDAKLVRAVIQVESAYQERARSRKGAMGLMQLMPATARQYAVADPYDPAANIEAGIKHLKSLLQRLPRDLALAAYNAGEAAVERFHGIPPYPETRSYVSRILQLASR